jgi:integrase
VKFTKDAIAALVMPPGKTDHIEWDTDLPGFGIRLRGERKSWVAQYRIKTGLQRRESFGDIRKVTLDDARKIARNRFAEVELGRDPVAERVQAKTAAKAVRLTLGVVAERYLAAKTDVVRARTYGQAKLHLTGPHWKPLHDRPIEDITRADIAARLQEITKEHGRTAASRARGNLSAMFGWAMREGLCDANPTVSTNDPADGIKPRERVLSDVEVGTVWRACHDDDFGRIVRLLILTGCRRQEIGELRWDEINLDTGVLTIPGTRTKNHRTHSLTLPPLALDILRAVPRRSDRDYVFGRDGQGFGGWSFATMVLATRIVAAEGKPLPHFVLHDCRRTMRTGLGKLGVAPHIAELCINHAQKSIQAVYDKHRYEREIKAALALWAQHVAAIVEGRARKVVPLRGA